MGQQIAIQTTERGDVDCNLCGSAARKHLFTKKGYHLVRCCDCGLAYIANPPDEDGIKAIYTAATTYHDQLLNSGTDDYQRHRRTALQHMKMLQRFRPKPAGLRVLDIGCSSGIFLGEARACGMHCQGVEISPDTSRFARDHYGLDVHQGDWRDAGYADASFDIITLFDVIEHLPNPKGELEAIRPLLKPGGLLLQSTPDIDGLFPRASYPLAKMLDYWPHAEPPHHLFQFSRNTLTAMVEAVAYRVEGAHRTRIDHSYNFGTPEHWRVSPKMLAYAALFAPIATIGGWLGQGDWLYLGATRD